MGDLEEPCTYDALAFDWQMLSDYYGFGEVDLDLAFPCVGRAYVGTIYYYSH